GLHLQGAGDPSGGAGRARLLLRRRETGGGHRRADPAGHPLPTPGRARFGVEVRGGGGGGGGRSHLRTPALACPYLLAATQRIEKAAAVRGRLGLDAAAERVDPAPVVRLRLGRAAAERVKEAPVGAPEALEEASEGLRERVQPGGPRRRRPGRGARRGG